MSDPFDNESNSAEEAPKCEPSDENVKNDKEEDDELDALLDGFQNN